MTTILPVKYSSTPQPSADLSSLLRRVILPGVFETQPLFESHLFVVNVGLGPKVTGLLCTTSLGSIMLACGIEKMVVGQRGGLADGSRQQHTCCCIPFLGS